MKFNIYPLNFNFESIKFIHVIKSNEEVNVIQLEILIYLFNSYLTWYWQLMIDRIQFVNFIFLNVVLVNLYRNQYFLGLKSICLINNLIICFNLFIVLLFMNFFSFSFQLQLHKLKILKIVVVRLLSF
jgi:hypothetical protein